MAGNIDIGTILNPKSIAVIGAYPGSEQNPQFSHGWVFFRNLPAAGFKGQLYPVDRRGGEGNGYKIYTSLKDVPGNVDYVICCIAARYTPQLVQECAEKGVKGIHFFTAGFSESGTEEGKQLEAEIVKIARQNGIRLIGPNCMGLYHPAAGISFRDDFPKEGGHVGLACQSGGNALYLVLQAAERGVRFSKVVSYGNACDINESDLLECLMNDDDTTIILLYIEGVKDGKRFKRLLREAAAVKPVLVFKGGHTQAGARAASSHTGSLAGASEVWDGLVRQSGAIPVSSLDEIIDLVQTLQYLPAPAGRRIGTLGVGGGATVVATDIYASAGLELPSLPRDLQDRLRGCVSSTAGLILNNPVDISGGYSNGALFRAATTLAEYDGIDVLVFYLPFTNLPSPKNIRDKMLEDVNDQVTRIRRQIDKPMAAVLYGMYNIELDERAFFYQKKWHEAGIPTYFSIEAAASALSKYISYHERMGNKY